MYEQKCAFHKVSYNNSNDAESTVQGVKAKWF